MFLLFIVFGALLLLILIAMNENGQLHNPPPEELAKYEALRAEEDRRRMGLGDGNGGYEDDGPCIDIAAIAGYYPAPEALHLWSDWDN